MGLDPEYPPQFDQIPIIHFSKGLKELDRETEAWNNLCVNVREACENYGCFEVIDDEIPINLKAEMFSVIRQLYDLPLDVKQKYVNPTRPSRGYTGKGIISPLFESFGIHADHASNYDSALVSFAELMWPPNGDDHFRQTAISMMELMDELNHLIQTIIIDSYGLGEKMESIMEYETLFTLMRYQAPPPGPPGESMIGLRAHTDKVLSAILCENQVSGLEVESKDGQWIKLSPSPTSFIFFVGDILKAWSNCRMHAVKHRVMMSGDKERYCLATFPAPMDNKMIKPPKELVDKDHPQIIKEFRYKDFVDFTYSEEARSIDFHMHIHAFAGIM